MKRGYFPLFCFMTYLLCIETSGSNCSIALGADGKIIALKETDAANSHASLSAVFIKELLAEAGILPNQLSAVAISEGPGSYTGLRIGTATAKGICYALNIPLIAVPTLQAMALEASQSVNDETALYAPMIDARRMEVYTGIYAFNNQSVLAVTPLILSPETHLDILEKQTVYYTGNGSIKWKEINTHKHARFINVFTNSAKNILPIAHKLYNEGKFANISYFEPQYLKLFDKVI